MTTAVKLTRFGGLAPKISTKLLPDGFGQTCVNAKLTSGDLVPYRLGKKVIDVPSAVSHPKTIFPMVTNSVYYWNMWTTDVDIAKAAVANISTQRIYFTGDGVPKTTDINRAVAPTTATKTGNYTQLVTDYETTVKWSGLAADATYALLAAATAGNQFMVIVHNADTVKNVIIDPNGAETVNLDGAGAAATATVAPGKIVLLKCNGTLWTATTKTSYPYDTFDLGVAAPVSAPTAAYVSVSKSAGYTTVAGDSGKSIDCTSTPWTLTLGDAATMGSSYLLVVRNLGTGTLTVNTTGGQLINGAASATLASGEITVITCNGTSFTGVGLTSGYTSYVYTYVTKWGEESAPSPASNILLRAYGQSMTITGLPTAPPVGNTNIVGYRVYRTNTGSTGTAYQLVNSTDVTIGAGTGTYTDTTLNSALGVVLPSTTWATPPTDLSGITNMANGMVAAFHNNEVCFCEPFKPFAWPVAYRYSVDSPIVGVAAIGNMLVVTTTGRPYIATGNHPSSVTVYPIDLPYPCLSKRGIVQMGQGVLYPSFEGMVYVTGSAPTLSTTHLFTRQEWQNWCPSTLIGKLYDGKYFGSYTKTDGSLASFVYEMKPSGSMPLFVDVNITWNAAYSDLTTGFFYFVYNDVLYQWDEVTMNYANLDWWSKEFVFDKPVNFGAAKLEATFPGSGSGAGAAIITSNIALIAGMGTTTGATYKLTDGVLGYFGDTGVGELEVGSDGLSSIPPSTAYIQFSLYTDGNLRFTKAVFDSTMFRLPLGYKSDTQSVRVSGPAIVHAILLAETPLALERIGGS